MFISTEGKARAQKGAVDFKGPEGWKWPKLWRGERWYVLYYLIYIYF